MGEKKVIHTVNSRTLIKSNIRNYSMYFMLAIIMLVFGPLSDWMNFSDRNITNIFFQYSYVLILAVGMVQCIIILGIDLSVGSVCAFIGALSAKLYNTGVGMTVTLAASLAMGLLIGAFQGWFVAYPKIPAFIVTLAGMMLFRGLTYIVTEVNPIMFIDDNYSYFATGTLDGDILHLEKTLFGHYPIALAAAAAVLALYWIMELSNRKARIENDFEVSPEPLFYTKLVIVSVLVLAIAERFASYRGLPIVVVVLGITVGFFHFIMKSTVLGRYIYAVGGNARSAKLSGINSEFITFVVFCIMGLLTGLGAVVSTGYMNSALPQAGQMFEMDAIAACYIGGVSASGGIGSVVGVIIGGLVMSAINNGMSLMNLGNHYQYLVKALILLLAVFYDVYSRRKSGLG
ncbi:MAG: sugar ABC transporter permease [Treponema sp.]|jgi:putative multiple sugar transport system permease protein|nr:sugar ABC transporter permease [Treponema sp.]